jgi:Uma2 family endonuclease
MQQQGVQRVTKPRLYLTPSDHGRRLTLEEFETSDTQEGYRYRPISGRLEVSHFPTLVHEIVVDWLRDLLNEYAEQHPKVINEVFGHAWLFLLDMDEGVTVTDADVAVYRDFPQDLSEEEEMELQWRDVFPVIVVEVVSPDTADKDLERNIELYLRVPSTREYWIVDPRESHRRPTLLVYRLRGQRWQKPIHVAPGGVYTTKLLPYFRLLLDRRA